MNLHQFLNSLRTSKLLKENEENEDDISTGVVNSIREMLMPILADKKVKILKGNVIRQGNYIIIASIEKLDQYENTTIFPPKDDGTPGTTPVKTHRAVPKLFICLTTDGLVVVKRGLQGKIRQIDSTENLEKQIEDWYKLKPVKKRKSSTTPRARVAGRPYVHDDPDLGFIGSQQKERKTTSHTLDSGCKIHKHKDYDIIHTKKSRTQGDEGWKPTIQCKIIARNKQEYTVEDSKGNTTTIPKRQVKFIDKRCQKGCQTTVDKVKNVTCDACKYFPHTIRTWQGQAGVGRTIHPPVSDGKPQGFTLYASRDIVDTFGIYLNGIKQRIEDGKVPMGIFTGMDLHSIGASGMNRPGVIGWISCVVDNGPLDDNSFVASATPSLDRRQGKSLWVTEIQSDLMQRTWDLSSRELRDVERWATPQKKQRVYSPKHRKRETKSEHKKTLIALAKVKAEKYKMEEAGHCHPSVCTGDTTDIPCAQHVRTQTGTETFKYTELRLQQDDLENKLKNLESKMAQQKSAYKRHTRLSQFAPWKPQIENIFKKWYEIFYKEIIDYAKTNGISNIYIPTTAHVISANRNANLGTNPQASIFHKLYDKVANELSFEPAWLGDPRNPDAAQAAIQSGWWVKTISQNESFNTTLDRVINEEVYGNLATVYHGTKDIRIAMSIMLNGVFPSLRGAFGPGLYAVYDPDWGNAHWLSGGSYGAYIIKLVVNISDKILILNYDDAKKYYGENYKIGDQLDQMGIKWRGRKEYVELDPYWHQGDIKWSDIDSLVRKYDKLNEDHPANTNSESGWSAIGDSSSMMKELSWSPLRFELNGIFFTGGHGRELVGFNAPIFRPMRMALNPRGTKSIKELEWHKIDEKGLEWIQSIADKIKYTTGKPTMPDPRHVLRPPESGFKHTCAQGKDEEGNNLLRKSTETQKQFNNRCKNCFACSDEGVEFDADDLQALFDLPSF